MSGIVGHIKDILAKLSTLQVTNQDDRLVPLNSRVWNNQFHDLEKAKIEFVSLPVACLELVNPSNYKRIGGGFDTSDIVFRIHLIHTFYDAADGTFAQDLAIFDLRDKVVTLLSNYEPTACGPLVRLAEEQSYDHDNLYHYIIDFTAHFIDSKGSPYDPESVVYLQKQPPLTLVINIDDEKNG